MRSHRNYWVLLLVIGGLLLLPAVKHFQQYMPHLSYWLKHTPLCMAENTGLLSPRRAHYSRELDSTIDILYCTPAKPPKLEGRPLLHDLIVVSDMGGVVQRIDVEGRILWQRRLSVPKGLDIHDGTLLVGEGRTLRVMSLVTGADLQTFQFDKPILMARRVGSTLFTLMDIDGKGAVRSYELSNNAVQFIKATSVETRYPRGIDVDASGLYVADTFGHRVIRLDPETLELQAEAASYFPNSVQVMGDRLLVAEEHLNVVSEFMMHPLVRGKTIVGCPAHLRGSDFGGIIMLEAALASSCHLSKSLTVLYSPNDAVAVDGHMYIADTDNHRVIEISDGRVVAQLTGFNNPVNVRAIRH